ncbi:3-oxoacyl-[acyl-carrier protein] reductase [Marinobacterium lacunae]|uniref:3-oxoacyl-[acyl-carrier protein] reductase n=1 Tax=Marinobacterium lacunae TaxID=1232683 RepID=A0A081FVY4_9GAMM|nr:SDR family oxidoreductase [Marinobacterium lacunae]KEA62689.1 3-oxoacyl-[acyl-carrier protein] reductase [Marinobacterium lacunae]
MSVNHFDHGWLGISGRTFVVTGAGSGIGNAIAGALISAGASVAMLDRNTQGCEALLSGVDSATRALVLECDIGNEDSVVQCVAAVEEAFGSIDGLVNCAGMLRAASIKDVKLDEWEAVLRTNLTGYMLCSRSFARLMAARGGAMVHIASVAAHHPQTHSGAYSASKAGISLLSRQIAVEYGEQGVRSNVICPGMIRTALSEPFYQHPGIKERREAMTASRRIGVPDDIANAAVFLLSPRASYINGAEFSVDGGMEAMLMDLIPRPGFTAA